MVSGVLIIRDMRAVKIMMCRLTLFVRWLSSIVCTTAAVRLENLALRHQIAVYQQSIFRTRLSLDMDCPAGRPVQSPECGHVRTIAELGGLHHHYERLAA